MKLTVLDEMGVHTVCSVLNAEYLCCQENNDQNVKGYNVIGIVKDEMQIDVKRV